MQVYDILSYCLDLPLEFKLHVGRVFTCLVHTVQGSAQSVTYDLINTSLIINYLTLFWVVVKIKQGVHTKCLA